jgi:asparagine synthase (glutamine-hydrolysing)
MCGFAGWFDVGPSAGAPPDEARRRAALDALAPRGPDGEGAVVGAHFGLLHRRLAVVDVAGGAQPMAGPRTGEWLAWNGEVFDHVERRKREERAGERFATKSDTELLARLLARDGARALDDLRAQFALAWVDERSLLLARDRCGEKPLCWRRDGDRVLFASTLDALHALAPFPRSLDREALSLYLSWGFVPAPWTIFDGVRKLRAGERLSATRDGVVDSGRLPPIPKHDAVDVTEAPAALRAALADAARIRLESADVPVGVFLSGGLDSLAVAAALRDRGPLRTFTVRSHDSKSDETDDARRAAAALGLSHEVIDAPPVDVDAWRTALLRFGEPFGASSAVAVDAMARAARGHVKVVMTGDGGDEALGGYERHRLLRRIAKLPRLPGVPVPASGPLRRLGRAFEIAALDPADRYAAMYEVFGVWCGRLTPGDDGAAARGLVRDMWNGAEAGDVAAMLRVDRAFELPDSHCVKVDVACMGNGVEARSPWLDAGVLAVCDAMPRRMRVSGSTTKIALREMLRRELPEPLATEILSRPKRGFTAGFDDALRTDSTRELLTGGALSRVPGVDVDVAHAIWREHRAGRGNHRFRLFVLTALALFAEAHLA